MGPIPKEKRREYDATRKRNRRCPSCARRLPKDEWRVHCTVCRIRQARWQRTHRVRRRLHAKAYRARKKARMAFQA